MVHVKCLVLTFNCGREPVKPALFGQHISEALKTGPTHDIVVLSLQEICPLPYGFIGGRSISSYYQKLNEAITAATGEGSYANIFTRNLGITATMIYVRKDRKDCVGSVESASTGVGWHELGNKGAVGVKLSWLTGPGKYIDLTFVGAHLAPHEHAVERRNQDWMHIVQRLVFESIWVSNKRLEASQAEGTDGERSLNETNPDERQPLMAKNSGLSPSRNNKDTKLSTIYAPMSYIFVAGDFNYRTADAHPGPDDHAKHPKFSDSSDLIKDLFLNDQLTTELKAGRTLHGFKEVEIDFAPTYKYAPEKQKELGEKEDDGTVKEYLNNPRINMGYAQHRWPSWCDRILYLAPFVEPDAEEDKVVNNFYKSLPLMSTSDHQPVIASFSIPLNRLVSPTDTRVTDLDDYRIQAPFSVDPLWRERFATARRKELAVGLAAYLGLTWEGNSIVAAAIVSVVGGYAIFKGGLF